MEIFYRVNSVADLDQNKFAGKKVWQIINKGEQGIFYRVNIVALQIQIRTNLPEKGKKNN